MKVRNILCRDPVVDHAEADLAEAHMVEASEEAEAEALAEDREDLGDLADRITGVGTDVLTEVWAVAVWAVFWECSCFLS